MKGRKAISIAAILIVLLFSSQFVRADYTYSIRLDNALEKAVFSLSYTGAVTGLSVTSPSGVTYDASSAGSAYQVTDGRIRIGVAYAEAGKWSITIYGTPDSGVQIVASSDSSYGSYAGSAAPTDPTATTTAPPTPTPTPKPVPTVTPTPAPTATPVPASTVATSTTAATPATAKPTTLQPVPSTSTTTAAITKTPEETVQQPTSAPTQDETSPAELDVTPLDTATPTPIAETIAPADVTITPAAPLDPTTPSLLSIDWRTAGLWIVIILAVLSIAILILRFRQQIFDRMIGVQIRLKTRQALRQEARLARQKNKVSAQPAADRSKRREELQRLKIRQKELKKLEAERKREERAKAKLEAERLAAEIREQQLVVGAAQRAAADKAAEEERIRKLEDDARIKAEQEKKRIEEERRFTEETAKLEEAKRQKAEEEAKLAEIKARSLEPSPAVSVIPFKKKPGRTYTPEQIELIKRAKEEDAIREAREKERRKEGEK